MPKKEKVNVISIPEDAIATVQIGGQFYQRLNKLILDFGDMHGKEKLVEALVRMKQGSTMQDAFSFNFETLLMLTKAIEESFQEQGLTKDNEVEIPIDPDLHKEVRDQMKNLK